MKRPILQKWHCVSLLLLVTGHWVNAQPDYSLVGTARSGATIGCYQLTTARDGQTGAVWFAEKLRLTESFDLAFSLNFGSDPNGADGLALVLQPLGTQLLGGAGRGMGYAAIRPSLAIEFDTNYNSEEGDIADDHVALSINGIIDHRLNTSFPPPTPISATQKNVKDGRDHQVKLSWNSTKKIVQVEVDCVVRISQTIDLVNTVFAGVTDVYWGFTAATGSASNAHTVCVNKHAISQSDTVLACRHDVVPLESPTSFNGTYQWLPATGLDNARIRTPKLTVDSSRLYVVQYTDPCNRLQLDSTFVQSKTPNLTISGPKSACSYDTITLQAVLAPATPATYSWSTGQKTAQIKPTASGTYSVTVTATGCVNSESAQLTVDTPPTLTLPSPYTYNCAGEQAITLDPHVYGSGLRYRWTPTNITEPTLTANGPGTYKVLITAASGCSAAQTFIIRDNCPPSRVYVPDVFTPNDDGINDVLVWHGESATEISIKLYDRWGEVLFTSTNEKPYWDGKYRDKPCPGGMYTWRIDGLSESTGHKQPFQLHGKVLLLN